MRLPLRRQEQCLPPSVAVELPKCTQFEFLILKMAVNDVDDLDDNWHMRTYFVIVCQMEASMPGRLFQVHYVTFIHQTIRTIS